MAVVKILSNDDGQEINKEDQVWHFVNDHGSGQNTLCGGEYFGMGESAVKYKYKERGKITCPECIHMIKKIKAIRL